MTAFSFVTFSAVPSGQLSESPEFSPAGNGTRNREIAGCGPTDLFPPAGTS
jgi:hypothetical protein